MLEIIRVLCYILMWLIINALPMWYVIYSNRHKSGVDPSHPNFKPWMRSDTVKWSYIESFFYSFSYWPRILFGWCAISACLISINLIYMGRGYRREDHLRKSLTMQLFALYARLHALAGGCVWSTNTRVHVDYSKYLGKDYVYRYDRIGIHVSNHIGMFDTIHAIYLKGTSASFISKREINNVPLLGRLVMPLDTILVGRDQKDSVDVRQQVFQQIEERAIMGEKGEITPITIFPEGCTTNGKQVIRFKKGAFAALRPVKPFSAKTWSLGAISANDGGALSFFKSLTILNGCIAWTYTLQEMPVFEPNEFFWKNHWDGKENKWEVYARAVQTLVAEQSGLEVSDRWVEDKLEYKKMVKGIKGKQE